MTFSDETKVKVKLKNGLTFNFTGITKDEHDYITEALVLEKWVNMEFNSGKVMLRCAEVRYIAVGERITLHERTLDTD